MPDVSHFVRLAQLALHRLKRVTFRVVTLSLVGSLALWCLLIGLGGRQDSRGPPPKTWEAKAARVKLAFHHAYSGYEKYASPKDELLPTSKSGINNFNGWGVTVYDSLDTMLLMGLQDEFARALKIVEAAEFDMVANTGAQFFETVIRYLGGLLSAYALSGEPILLQKAEQLGRGLAPAFNTNSGLPLYSVNPATGETGGLNFADLAEIASCQIEYLYLAKATGNKEYFDIADKVIHALARADVRRLGGMLPIQFNLFTGNIVNTRLSVGAAADSGHEYLLKQYLMTANTDKTSLEMYLRMTTQIIANLMYLSSERGMLYVTDTDTNDFVPSHRFEHLACFFPGLLALGAHTLPLDDLPALGLTFAGLASALPPRMRATYTLLSNYSLRDLHMWAAQGSAQTCWLLYADARAGLAPDEVQFHTAANDSNTGTNGSSEAPELWISALERWRAAGSVGDPPGVQAVEPMVYTQNERRAAHRPQGRERDYDVHKAEYLLRPETVESFYLLWRTTGDSRWRERGWAVFEAIEAHCRTRAGYASVRDVDAWPIKRMNMMPSFFLAETLKYLYLLFTDEDLVPLDKWVFNTEAHPLPIFQWSPAEKAAFGIK